MRAARDARGSSRSRFLPIGRAEEEACIKLGNVGTVRRREERKGFCYDYTLGIHSQAASITLCQSRVPFHFAITISQFALGRRGGGGVEEGKEKEEDGIGGGEREKKDKALATQPAR